MEHKILARYPIGNPRRTWRQDNFILSTFQCKGENMRDAMENINTIAPTFQPGQKNAVKGRGLSRAVRCSLVQFQKFINQQQVTVC